ncbi:MAG: hypothetical protein AABY22_00865 [Nanoarchaeota archaeon]
MNRKPIKYSKLKDIESELNRIILTNKGKFPTARDLRSMGREDLVGAIYRNYGGFVKIKKEMDYPLYKKGPRAKFNYQSKEEIELYIRKHHFKQSITMIAKNNLSLYRALHRENLVDYLISQGILVSRKKIRGKELLIFEEARSIMEKHELKELPSQRGITKLGYSKLANKISTLPGGYREFRRRFGEKQKRIPDGLWQDLDFTLERATEVMHKYNFDKFPGEYKLRKLGLYPLFTAINRYHGGFPRFREILNERLGISSEQNKLENLLDSYNLKDIQN